MQPVTFFDSTSLLVDFYFEKLKPFFLDSTHWTMITTKIQQFNINLLSSWSALDTALDVLIYNATIIIIKIILLGN